MRKILTVLSAVLIVVGCGPQPNTAPPATPETTSDTPPELRWVYGTFTVGDVRSEFSARMAGEDDPVSIDEAFSIETSGWGRATYRFEHGSVRELRSETARRDAAGEGTALERERLDLRFAQDGTVAHAHRTVDGVRHEFNDDLISDSRERAAAIHAAARVAAAPSADDSRFVLGRLTWGHEVLELEICGEPGVRWLHDPAGVVGVALPERMPYEPLSVVLRGRDVAPPAAEFAAEAEAAFEVVEVVNVRRVGRREDCFGRELLALGVEPFWSLEVRSDGNVLLKDLGADELRWLSVAARVEDDHGRSVFELTDADMNSAGTLVVTGEGCTDPMAGELFPLTASLRLDDRVLNGCAEPGLLAAPARPGAGSREQGARNKEQVASPHLNRSLSSSPSTRPSLVARRWSLDHPPRACGHEGLWASPGLPWENPSRPHARKPSSPS
jgi:uncharacterized membrane protein